MDWIVAKVEAGLIGRRSMLRSDTKRPDRKHWSPYDRGSERGHPGSARKSSSM